MRTPAFMLIPSLTCQASCAYCFGPHRGAVMDARTAAQSVRFIHDIARETDANEISITFHGGEPLLAPFTMWETLLNETRERLASYRLRLNLQSNLWNLDDAFLRLFREHGVSIGTSLDGPRPVCDANRGEGYYDRTFSSLEKAEAAGFPVSAIATVTKQTLGEAVNTAAFFRDRGIPLVLHGALTPMGGNASPYALTAREYAGLTTSLLDWYAANRKRVKIDTLDHYARGVVTGNPGVCTFRDCLGMFLAVSPTGDITSCQRLAGKSEFSMGSVFDKPTLETLYASEAAQRQKAREAEAAARCADCGWVEICRGGCYYNALASGDGVIDSYCESYKAIYDFTQKRVLEDMTRAENIAAISEQPTEPGGHPFLREGPYISLSHAVHPYDIADNARRVLAIHELGKTNDAHIAAVNLNAQKICGSVAATEKILRGMRENLTSAKPRNNCYIHVTYNCNLRCTHCYADAGEALAEMGSEAFRKLAGEAIGSGFRQIVVTGGEPLAHADRDGILDACREHKGKGANIVLRTNLTGGFTDGFLETLARSADQVVVSVDGNEQTHDARRGAGTYANVTDNLERYAKAAASVKNAAELSLACVMGAAEINGEPGRSVRLLGESLGVKRVRFRPLLPLGRAANWDEPVMCEGLMQHVTPKEMLKSKMNPLTTCGIGQNIFIKPDGDTYPCYALCETRNFIANVLTEGLQAVLDSAAFTCLSGFTVDTVEKCRDCGYRYLCGGACRAWGNRGNANFNAAPVKCSHLSARAEALIAAARAYLED